MAKWLFSYSPLLRKCTKPNKSKGQRSTKSSVLQPRTADGPLLVLHPAPLRTACNAAFIPELLQVLEPGSNSHVLHQLGKHWHPRAPVCMKVLCECYMVSVPAARPGRSPSPVKRGFSSNPAHRDVAFPSSQLAQPCWLAAVWFS